ncbi:MAG: bifunctional methylenetetrahydrofolate dehydrogenase/methenyltetrahydrofolate cyclohydrolase FolD [Coriobacteriia bacterium]|nr:bifunctional methylenetetrahydrofolate dehydrogenase/methenyltetrahydrofolate cyclohydrolase FolD [Coriobacteriia bacterium]MCL2745835.1 bifunctional methylenetetrahydrofolate dehydrogenase/methenyltetrahydrofolate cyclohydrolase FolD [Coriobacteriia bacterium]MCL2870545.1 bifunctional methylenetetrahydrofolate dehydrogenase/methenyltetrahydrofolate cyclohydrolase FolD [Coriobacteriia bacterium]
MTLIIDGNHVAAITRKKAAESVRDFGQRTGGQIGLAVVLVGDDPASAVYVNMKEQDCAEVGIRTFDHRLSEAATQADLSKLIDDLNTDNSVHGILVQLPLPQHLDEEAIIAQISPEKDVDGFTPENLGRTLRGLDALRACTPLGVMRLLEHYDIDVEGKHAVVVGRSTIVGKPQSLLLLENNATVTICHSRTQDLPAICRQADILVAAAGIPKLLDADYIKPGATVIDVGINRSDDGLVGDVDFEAASHVASAITPVPGGVGPMTRAMLVENTVTAAQKQCSQA